MNAATVWIALGGYYAGALIYFFAVGWLYPRADGAAIMMEAAIWPFWTVRRLWWAVFGPPLEKPTRRDG